MDSARVDFYTYVVFVSMWPIYLLWEIALLLLRGKGIHVDTISMVARDRAYQMNSMVFAWCGLAAHYWLNWYKYPTWESPIPAVIFWLLVAGTLTADILLWEHPYSQLPSLVRAFRAPRVQVFWGMACGFLLFPQPGRWPS